jgi:hypothetical protein
VILTDVNVPGLGFLKDMTTDPHNYNLFFRFIETYWPVCFVGIDRNELLMLKLEQMTEVNNQYFFAGDLLQRRIIFSSKRSV